MTQKQWMLTVVEYGQEYGCIATGRSGLQHHHVVGPKGKQNKVLIGPWFVLPIWWELHDVSSNNPNNVTHFRHRFTDLYGKQKLLFAEMVETLQNGGIEVPEEDILSAISLTNM